MPRGPAPKKLDKDERIKFLGLVRSGFGVHMALSEMHVGHARYYRTIKSDREFLAEVRGATAYSVEQLVAMRYTQAMDGDGRALDFLIARSDRAAEFARTIKLRREESRAADENLRAEDLRSLVAEAEKRAEERRNGRTSDGSAS